MARERWDGRGGDRRCGGFPIKSPPESGAGDSVAFLSVALMGLLYHSDRTHQVFGRKNHLRQYQGGGIHGPPFGCCNGDRDLCVLHCGDQLTKGLRKGVKSGQEFPVDFGVERQRFTVFCCPDCHMSIKDSGSRRVGGEYSPAAQEDVGGNRRDTEALVLSEF